MITCIKVSSKSNHADKGVAEDIFVNLHFVFKIDIIYVVFHLQECRGINSFCEM